MIGAIVFVVVMALVIPVAVMMAGALWSAVFGFFAAEAVEGRESPEPRG